MIHYLVHLAINLAVITAVGYILLGLVFGPLILGSEIHQRIKERRK